MLVLDEDGKGVRECKVSISHDGEYASALALVEDDNLVQKHTGTVGQGAVKGTKQARRRKHGRQAGKEVTDSLIRSVATGDPATIGDQMTSSENTKGQVRLRYLPTRQTAGYVKSTTQEKSSAGEEEEVKKTEQDLKPPDFFW